MTEVQTLYERAYQVLDCGPLQHNSADESDGTYDTNTGNDEVWFFVFDSPAARDAKVA